MRGPPKTKMEKSAPYLPNVSPPPSTVHVVYGFPNTVFTPHCHVITIGYIHTHTHPNWKLWCTDLLYSEVAFDACHNKSSYTNVSCGRYVHVKMPKNIYNTLIIPIDVYVFKNMPRCIPITVAARQENHVDEFYLSSNSLKSNSIKILKNFLLHIL